MVFKGALFIAGFYSSGAFGMLLASLLGGVYWGFISWYNRLSEKK